MAMFRVRAVSMERSALVHQVVGYAPGCETRNAEPHGERSRSWPRIYDSLGWTLQGVEKETAVTVALEFGSFSRFEGRPRAMSYTGLVASEYTSGKRLDDDDDHSDDVALNSRSSLAGTHGVRSCRLRSGGTARQR